MRIQAVCCLLSLCLALAGNSYSSGGTAMDAFNFVTGARAAGMGGAQTAAVADATSLQYNPAALVRVRGFSAELSSLFWVFDIQYHYLSFALPMFGGGYGASVQYLNYGPIESTEGLAPAIDASDMGFSVGGSYEVTKTISVGTTVKYFSHQYSHERAAETAVDLGLTYVPAANRLAFGLVFQNLGYASQTNGIAPPLPVSVRGGLAYAFDQSDPLYFSTLSPDFSYTLRFLLAADVSVYQTNEAAGFNLGGETAVSDLIFLRMGYMSAIRNTGGGWNLGVGTRGFGVRIDYALGMVGKLGYGQYVTFTVLPGSGEPKPASTAGENEAVVPKKVERKKAVKPEDVEETDYVPGESMPLKGKYLTEYGKALEDYNDKEYQSSITRLHAILEKNLYSWEAWQLLGNCRYAIGSRPGAIRAYRRALKINPVNPQLESFVKELEK